MNHNESILFATLLSKHTEAAKLPGRTASKEVCREFADHLVSVAAKHNFGLEISPLDVDYAVDMASNIVREPVPTVTELHLLIFIVQMWVASRASAFGNVEEGVRSQRHPVILESYLDLTLKDLTKMVGVTLEPDAAMRKYIIDFCMKH